MTPKASCLKCSRYLTCKDPEKAPKYKCDRFLRLKEIGSILELGELAVAPGGESPSAFEVNLEARMKSPIILPEELSEYDLEDVDEDDLSEDFVWKAMKKAFDPDTNTVRDLKVDDSDLAMADNYYHFCTKIAGKAIKSPFARQLWIAYTLMGEVCHRCTPDFYTETIENIPVDMDSADLVKKISLFRRGVCPKCKGTKSQMILGKEMIGFNQLVMVAGQRAGKSAFSSTIAGYHTHLMFKAPRLSEICRGIQDFTTLTGTFVALTTGRAIKLQWNPFHTMITSSEWFQSYFKMLDHYGKKYGKEFYKLRGLFLRVFSKNLDYYPMGPMKRTLRGDTRIISSVDELGWFPFRNANAMAEEDEDSLTEGETGEDDEREMADANEVHQALDNSLSTIRAEVWDLYKRNINTVPNGLNLLISSPKSWQDKICRLFKESENPATLSLGLRLPTWEINPLYTRDHPVITSAYAKNARRAERDFGANPPRIAENAFNKAMVQASFRGKQHHFIDYDESNPEYTVGKVKELIIRNQWRCCTMGMDAGLNNNSFALAIGSREGETVVTHSVLELIPSKNKPIHYPMMYKQVMLPIIKSCNVLYVGGDRWNSINLLQQAEEDTGGRTKFIQVTLNEADFKEYQLMVNSGNQIFPKPKWEFAAIEEVKNYRHEMRNLPADHLYLQFHTSQNVNGIITKGDGYTDDVLRAQIVMSTMHFIPRVRTYLEKFKPLDRTGLGPRSIVMIGGRSGGTYMPVFGQPTTPDEPYYDPD